MRSMQRSLNFTPKKKEPRNPRMPSRRYYLTEVGKTMLDKAPIPEYEIILDRLFDGPSTIEELKEKTGLTIGQLRLSLVRFYQKGWVRYWGV